MRYTERKKNSRLNWRISSSKSVEPQKLDRPWRWYASWHAGHKGRARKSETFIPIDPPPTFGWW